MEKININKMFEKMPWIVLLFVAFLTIGFASFSSNNNLKSLAQVTPALRWQISNFYKTSATNNGDSNYENDNIDTLSTGVYLPNDDSTVTYRIDLINLGVDEGGILQILGLPDNIEAELTDYTLGQKICDNNNCGKLARKTFYMTLKYKQGGRDSSVTTYPLDLTLDFRNAYNISYDGFVNTQGLETSILAGDTKTIVFDNNTSIPIDVSVTGALGSYNSPNLTISNATENIVIYKKHLITYVLNGGTQADGQVTTISSNETVTLLEPTKPEYHFAGWYTDPDFTSDQVTTLSNVTSDITLYACFATYDYYVSRATFDGTTSSVINTGIELYSAENVNRNFRIAFTIDNYTDRYNTASNISSSSPPTIVSSMLETRKPWPGFVFRVSPNSNVSYYNVKVNDSHVTSFNGYYGLSSGIDVEIVREDGALYTKVNSNIYTKVLDYASTIDIFDVPLTIGGNINSSGNYDRCFDGTLSNVIVEFYEGTSIVNNYSYTESRTSSSYNLNGTIMFDGTNYIDTGLNLFSAENINKDFDISLTIDALSNNSNQATLINAKDESQNNVWPGFAYRLSSGTKYELTARWPGQSQGSAFDSSATPRTVSIKRRNGIIYYSYSGSPDAKLIETPAQSLTNPFSSNLTFGASTNSSGQPFRYFSGIVSNISVQLYDS